MELNLYGISSIKLDKMKKRQIRRFLICWAIVYVAILLIASRFPQAFSVHFFKNPQIIDKEGAQSVVSKGCVEMDPSTHDYFELLANVQIELYQQLSNDDTINLRYQVGMFSTMNEELGSKCDLTTDSALTESKSQTNPDKWNALVESQSKVRTLSCTQLDSLKLNCTDVPIASGGIEDQFKHNGFLFNIDTTQSNFKLISIDVNLKQRNVDHTYHLSCMKYIFAALTFAVMYFYWKTVSHFQMDDLGIIQKWIMMLLFQLFLFNEPFTGLRWVFPYKSYYIIQAITQSTFLSMILFFWLVIVHSISSNEVINIDEKRFYLPKIILCFSIWVTLTLSMGYINLKQVSDPSFYWRDDLGQFYSTVQIISVILFVLYSTYFVIIAYVAFFQLKDMKKSYKFSLFLTFAVILASITLIICEGYSASQNNSVLFVAFISLFNTYMYIIAYLYSPSVDSLEDLQYKQARKEHEHIINQFYEQELPDISKDEDHSRTQIQTTLNNRQQVEKRRYHKKDPQQKAKDKLWESIVKETEVDEEDSSDDEHQI